MPRLSEMVRRGFSLGTHVITITDVEEAASQSGNPKLHFSGTDETGKEGGWDKSLTTNALWSLRRDLVSLGIDEDVPGEEPEHTLALVRISKSLVGMRILANVEQDGEYTRVNIQGPAETSESGVLDTSRL